MEITVNMPSLDGLKTLLMEQYSDSANLLKLLSTFSEQLDATETVALQIKNIYGVSTSSGDQLDQIGGVFAVERSSRTDAQYRIAINSKLALQGQGTVEDLIRVYKVLFGATWVKYTITAYGILFDTDFAEHYPTVLRYCPAGIDLRTIFDLVSGESVARKIVDASGNNITGLY